MKRSRKEAVNSGETRAKEAVNWEPVPIGDEAEAVIARFKCWPADNSAGDGSGERKRKPMGMSSDRDRREPRQQCRPVASGLFRPSSLSV